MWKFLFGGVLGFGAAVALSSGKSKEKKDDKFIVDATYKGTGDNDGGDEHLEESFENYGDAKKFYDKVFSKKRTTGKFILEQPSSYVRSGMAHNDVTMDTLPANEKKEISKERWKLIYVVLRKGDDNFESYESKRN